jgi:hypothetical protein
MRQIDGIAGTGIVDVVTLAFELSLKFGDGRAGQAAAVVG